MNITNPKNILDYFNENIKWKGHFDCRMPDGTEDDYDTSVPDFAIKQKYKKDIECNDSNGSSPNECILIGGKATFIVSVADRDYTVGEKDVTFSEMEVLCTIKEIETSEDDEGDADGGIVVINKVKILSCE